MKKLLLTAALGALAACSTPEPICDREAQPWDKFGTQEDTCDAPDSGILPAGPVDSGDPVPTGNPTPDTPPDSGPESPDSPDDGGGDPVGDTPSGKVKSDNSDANGKGGNKHDRTDKTKGGTETAERKKGV